MFTLKNVRKEIQHDRLYSANMGARVVVTNDRRYVSVQLLPVLDRELKPFLFRVPSGFFFFVTTKVLYYSSWR